MGGAGVALVNDNRTAHWNPGALAFAHSTEFELPFSGDFLSLGEAISDADDIVNFIQSNSFDTVLTKIQSGQALTLTELQNTLEIANKLSSLGAVAEGYLTGLDAGLSMRKGGMLLTARTNGSFGIDPVFDIANFSFSNDIDALTQVANVVGAGADRSSVFTNTSSQGLANTIAAAFGAWSQDQAEELVFQTELAGLDTSVPTIQDLISRVASSTGALSALDLSQNSSGVVVRGLLTQEIGLGYGLSLFNERIGIGANVRAIHGISYYNFVQFDDITGGTDNLIDDITDTHNRETSQRVALDLGLLVRPKSWLRVGLVARNVNSPKFKSGGPDSVELAEQVRLGVAVTLLPNWVVAADIDLTENESEAIDGFESRMLSLGTEFNIPFWVGNLALRAGAYTNLADEGDDGLTVTAGVGLRLSHFQFDIAAGAATTREELEAGGRDIPSRMHISGAIKWVTEF
ncbi:MAG: conjugal transfer protein TraF [Myxococcota bacterium]